MSDGLFRSLSGALSAWKRMEVVSNNAANVSTTGFQAGRIAFETYGDGEHLGEGYAAVSTVRPVRVTGPLQATGQSTDVALQGPGYFAIETADGVLFTRDGQFHVSREGFLANREGYPVVGDNGPIVVPPGESVKIGEDGTVSTSESGVLGRLARMDGPLSHAGGNLWKPTGAMLDVETPVSSGHLEGSSVDPMRTMVELIEASRHFEMLQKAMQSNDEMTTMMNQSGS